MSSKTVFVNSFYKNIVILQMFTVGTAFKGIKMIPPGIHFVFYSSSTRFFQVFICSYQKKKESLYAFCV